MQVSKLSQVLALSWVLLVASVALSTLLQVAVAPRSLVGYVTAGATPVWLLGSFAVLSLLYRAQLPDAAPLVDVDQDHDAGQAGERQRWRPVADLVCSVCGGQRAEHTVHHDQAAHERARRRCEALLRKAAGTPFEHEAAACRAKADALRAKYGL